MKYTFKQFQKEFETHLGYYGCFSLFYYLLKKQGNTKNINTTSSEVLEWNFKTDMELMDIGSELFKQEMLENKRSSFSNLEVEEKIGKDNILDVKDSAGFIGYLVKDY